VLLKESIHVVLGTSRDELSMDHIQSNEPADSCSSDQPGNSQKVPGRSQRPSGLLVTIVVMWLVIVASALGFIANYSQTPGGSGSIPLQFPRESRIQLDAQRPTLVMFAHPHCPCTRASIGELNVLMAQCRGQFNAHVFFAQPGGVAEDWSQTTLWQDASAIPGVTVHNDLNGVESRRFRAETSGQTLLYDSNGKLLFHGGITISRGHSGDNPGRTALVALISGNSPAQKQSPVFGCALFDSDCQPGGDVCRP
jgi:hypothetical protein